MTSEPSLDSNFLSSLQYETCLGLGGFGIVLKARDPSTDSSSAVKFIFSNDPNEKEILRECTLARGLDHGNIVKILNVAQKHLNAEEIETIFSCVPEDDVRSLSFRDTNIGIARRRQTVGSIAIQMELCGETLRKWLHQDHDPNDSAVHDTQVQIAQGMVSGLTYLHDQKIIHRDLKPENIMFSKIGFILPVKIGDFGLCRTLHSHPESHTSSLTSRTGTLDYMAPEAFTKYYTLQVDLFSLGLVLWEVFQLIKFHDRGPLFDGLVNDRKGELVKVDGVLRGIIKQLIVNLTKKKVEDRTPSVRSLQGIFRNESDSPPDHFVSNSAELETSLRDVDWGGRIVLAEGVFQGEFVLEKNRVQIIGKGSGETVLKGLKGKTCLIVKGNDCTMSGLTMISQNGSLSITTKGINLIGYRNRVHNVDLSGGGYGIHVEGDENVIEDLTISTEFYGIKIEGFKNTMQQIKVEDMGLHGIVVRGSHNSLSHIHIQLLKRSGLEDSAGVWLIHSGSFNTISNLTCSGYSRDKGDWGLRIHSPDSSVTDSDCGPVEVRGSDSSLSNVNCGDQITIQDFATGVTLTKCRGQMLIFHDPVVTTDCHFDEIVNKEV